MPKELEKYLYGRKEKSFIEVAPQTHTDTSKTNLAEEQQQLATYSNSNEHIPEMQSLPEVELKTTLSCSERSKATVENATKLISLGNNQNKPEILITDALEKLQNSSKQLSVHSDTNSNEINNVVIDKQLAVTGPSKKLQSVYTLLNNDQIINLRKHAQEAVRQNKIFIIRGNYNSVRQALTSRGWVEKLMMHRKAQLNSCDLPQLLPERKTGETRRQFIAKVERNIMSRCVENVLCDFLWTPHKDKTDHAEQSKNPNMLINKFERTPFTNKESLNAALREMSAFYEEDVADIRFPRCFNVWSPEELTEFIDNFKLTACIAFVHWLVEKYRGGGFSAVFSPTGKIPFASIDFAFERCLEFINVCQHTDIDVEDTVRVWEHDWDAYLHQHYQMVHDGLKILANPQNLVEAVIARGTHILNRIQYFWPQLSIDGYQNLWIIKPANKCRGRGIHLSNNLKKTLNFVNPSTATKSRFVIQKYMERPLIIYRTKFDIRQWFLISSLQPLTIWMYKECYLRFSTQEYTLANSHEAVHLTNHAIQKKYTNSEKRDKRLPNENMWDSYSFQAYLRQIGKKELWLERIYPGMRKAIVAAVLVSQEHMERTSNAFELFGADFMICENFYPWLIEINSNPDLAASTSVTARMCPQCLEDVIKVIIDRRNDAKADVGNFELIYRQNLPSTPAYTGLNIIVRGKKILNHVSGHRTNFSYQQKEKSLHTNQFFKYRRPLSNVSQVHKPMPSFNAAEYIEKLMVELPTVSSHSSAICEQKSFSNLIVVSAIRDCQTKGSSPKSTRCPSLRSALKRRRSCGPRLSANYLTPDSKDDQNSKLFTSSHYLQVATKSLRHIGWIKQNNLLNAHTSTVSKSADNIKQLYSPLKKKLQCPKGLSTTMPLKKILSDSKTQMSFVQKVKPKEETKTASPIHAIGKNILGWNSNNNKTKGKQVELRLANKL